MIVHPLSFPAIPLLEELNLIIRVKFDDGLFPVGPSTFFEAETSFFPVSDLRANRFDPNGKHLLDGILDIRFGRVNAHLEGVGIQLRAQESPFFGHQRSNNHLVGAQFDVRPRGLVFESQFIFPAIFNRTRSRLHDLVHLIYSSHRPVHQFFLVDVRASRAALLRSKVLGRSTS